MSGVTTLTHPTWCGCAVCSRDCLPADGLARLLRPLIAESSLLGVGRRFDAWYGTANGTGARMIYRILAGKWLTVDNADRWAILLGVHPVELYPDWFGVMA